MASRTYQYEYIVNGTQDEYVVPEEMVDTVRTSILEALRNATGFTEVQIGLLTEMEELTKSAYDVIFDYDRNSLSTMIDSNEWSAMRKLASRCLCDLGIQERDMEELLIDA